MKLRYTNGIKINNTEYPYEIRNTIANPIAKANNNRNTLYFPDSL